MAVVAKRLWMSNIFYRAINSQLKQMRKTQIYIQIDISHQNIFITPGLQMGFAVLATGNLSSTDQRISNCGNPLISVTFLLCLTWTLSMTHGDRSRSTCHQISRYSKPSFPWNWGIFFENKWLIDKDLISSGKIPFIPMSDQCKMNFWISPNVLMKFFRFNMINGMNF